MKKIHIKATFRDDSISRVAGEKLRLLILDSFDNKEPICLDFTDVVIASTSFFDEGIAKLVSEGWDGQRLKKWVRFEGMSAGDQKVLKKASEFRGLKIEGPL